MSEYGEHWFEPRSHGIHSSQSKLLFSQHENGKMKIKDNLRKLANNVYSFFFDYRTTRSTRIWLRNLKNGTIKTLFHSKALC